MNTHPLLRATDGADAQALVHSRAIGAPKRPAKPTPVKHPVHPMTLAMSEVYQFTPTHPQLAGADLAQGQDTTMVTALAATGPTSGSALVGYDPAAPAATVAKTYAIWRRAADIPQEERVGLWHYRDRPSDEKPGWAFHADEIDSVGLYLNAAPGVKAGDAYDPSLYTQPDAKGWFAHEPVAEAVCPVPAGVLFQVRLRDGSRDTSSPGEVWNWTGQYRDGSPIGDGAVVAWWPL